MNLARMLAIPAVTLALAACGSDFEWFPKTADTTAPTITATIESKSLFNNQTTHVSSLPANVVFAANEAATVYYTTSGAEPTTTSPSVTISSTAGVTGPSVSISGTILKFFGIDTSSKKNQSATHTSTIKSP